MNDLSLLSLMLAQPVAFVFAAMLFGWRYRKALAHSMTRSTQARSIGPAWVASVGPALVPASLRIDFSASRKSDWAGSQALALLQRAKAVNRAAKRCYLLAGALYWGSVVAIHLWAVPWARNRSYLLPLIAVIAALPGLIVLLSALAHSRRIWVGAISVYFSVLIAAALIVAWHVGDVAKTISVVYTLAEFHALPVLGLLILMQRRLRSLLVALVAVLLFLMAGIAGMWLALGALDLDQGVVDTLRTAKMRWPLPAMVAMGTAGFAIGVWIFIRVLRSRRRLPLVGLLAAMLVAGPILDSMFQPRFPLGPLLSTVPANVLQCLIVWLFFKGLVALQAKHWLPSQVLQLHLAWTYLALFSLFTLQSFLSEVSPARRATGFALFVGAFAAYFAITHWLLRRGWMSRRGEHPKKLVLLRVFGASDKQEQLLDVLEDTWRRIGRIDLIGGTDVAMRTLRSLMLECFLLRSTDREFLKTTSDVDARLSRLSSELESDLRYPVNEIFCYADAWQAAVLRLAPIADVVLLDLRGFTRANKGCEFELTNVIWYVSLVRVVVLTDETTDAAALREVAFTAWAALPIDSPNRSVAEATLQVMAVDEPSTISDVPLRLFQTAAGRAEEQRA